MRWLITGVLCLLVIALEAAVGPLVTVLDVRPSLLVILVVQISVVMPELEGVIWSWGLGLVKDLHDQGVTGVLALTYALIALGVARNRSALFAGHLLTRVLLVVVAGLLQHLALMFSIMIPQIIRGQPLQFLLFWRDGLLGVAYTAVVAVGLLPLLSLVLSPLYVQRRRS